MAKKKKERLTFDETPPGLNDAFGGLDLGGQHATAREPSTPEPEPPEPVASVGKPGSCCLRRETAHRGGKCVVVVYDLPATLNKAAIDTLARDLKQHCGTGGTVKNREIQVQGEKAQEVRAYLEDRGWRVRGV